MEENTSQNEISLHDSHLSENSLFHYLTSNPAATISEELFLSAFFKFFVLLFVLLLNPTIYTHTLKCSCSLLYNLTDTK